jgi:hypothetical protein
MKKRVISIFIALSVDSCATAHHYATSNNVTQEQFYKDRYACMQETTTVSSSFYVDRSGGAGRTTTAPTCSAFTACLAARGYFKITGPDDPEAQGKTVLTAPPRDTIHCT